MTFFTYWLDRTGSQSRGRAQLRRAISQLTEHMHSPLAQEFSLTPGEM